MSRETAAVPTEARLGRGTTPWPLAEIVHVVHVGQSVVLLADGARLLPVTGPAHGLVPGGARIPEADLRALADTARRSATLDVSGWAETPSVSWQDLTLTPGPVDRRAAVALWAACVATGSTGPMSPAPQRRAARELVAAALARPADIGAHLTALVGAGPGSTPAGDDVVVGVLAGLDRSGAALAAAAVRRALPDLLDRTTALSRHELAAAIEGHVAERVHTLVAALADPALVPGTVRAARAWGASSGLDLASGVAAAALVTSAPTTVHIPPTDRRSA
ncbi:DUF2877 domain-containing protein [Georgenia sp. 311]|uniref:DUF2877 domain-containing protein n=1 Tax=Georgenia wutianyii TaxID=2585135 RepID=A0ABX5VJJ5_9MICO|nr:MULTISPECIES: DUF2877 domain-containing protein [Georgenia]QDB78285.1 DUF2877 domain-containing protein [Georgenia wutianyii]TNC19981.1 DUF2877 domain-containing protein [Georgenia sp. 311]